MTASLVETTLDEALGAHLDRQLESARRMREIVCGQAAAIRRRDVRVVVAAAGALQVEMHRRELLERERMALMERAARQLGTTAERVGFTSVRRLLEPETAQVAAAQTAELTALLAEIDREHTLNRKLLAQELAFLDHLLALADGTGAYAARRPAGSRVARSVNPSRRRVFDLEA